MWERSVNSIQFFLSRSYIYFSDIAVAHVNLLSYGLIWVSTTLVFVIAALGNLSTYLIGSSSWNFDVSFMSLAASTVYGYAIVVPLGFYFLFQYLGSPASVVRFWCMWGYSLFIFVLSCVSAHISILLPSLFRFVLLSLLKSITWRFWVALFFYIVKFPCLYWILFFLDSL